MSMMTPTMTKVTYYVCLFMTRIQACVTDRHGDDDDDDDDDDDG